jgi:NADP-dependent 3-hydroxy acid dehydrogenase YdfG|tara:strand:+ start:8041 stop:8793 length:753 start_codon:yes stop_codon:yes gene_type:complete
MLNLSGKTVLITGASQGIGAAAAKTFMQAGANVMMTARNLDKLEKIKKELGDRTEYLAGDISDPSFASGLVDFCYDHFGALDILINNAGTIQPIGLIHEIKPEEWSNVIDTNLKSVFYTINSVLPKMIENGEGTILNVSSGAAHNPLTAWSHYCASKAGAAMLTQCLHTEYFEHGIRAMGLSPGTVATQMQLEIKESGINQVSKLDWSAHIPAEWPAKALLWMCGPEANEFVGKEILLRDEVIRKKIKLI